MRNYGHTIALTLVLFGAAGAAEARTLSLRQAASDPQLTVRVASNGGFNAVQIAVTNRGEDEVRILGEVGEVLENRNEEEQNLVLGEALRLDVAPGKQAQATLSSYCINLERHSPSAGARFAPATRDAELARVVRNNGGGRGPARSSVQSAVWQLTEARRTGSPSGTPRGRPNANRIPVDEPQIVE